MLAGNIAQFAWIARPNGSIFWFNKRPYEYTGLTPREMKGWGFASTHRAWLGLRAGLQAFEMWWRESGGPPVKSLHGRASARR